MTTELTKAAQQALEACPFCGCDMRIESNRDWHKLRGNHAEGCVFSEDAPVMTVPATDCQLEVLVHDWNNRALTQRPAAQTERDTGPRVLREVFAVCEDTMDKMAAESTEFSRGRAFEAKGISRAIGTWFQDEYCGRSHMGEPSLPAPQQATPATHEDIKVYDGIAAGYFADTQQATPEPVPAEQAKWCEYVAGMVDCWVSAEWSNYYHKDEDRRVKAIAGIIERRLWALQKQPTTPEPVTLGPLAKRNIFDAIRGAYDLGYNDARNARTVPGDSAPGYDGRSVEEDHGGALFNTLSKRLTPATPEPVGEPLQGGLDNDALLNAWRSKLPGVTPTDAQMTAFALGVEVGFAHARTLERSDWGRVHEALQAAGVHPGRTDDHLADVIAKALATRPAPGVPDVEDLRDRLVAISAAVADSDDRAAQSMLGEILRTLAAQAKGGEQ